MSGCDHVDAISTVTHGESRCPWMPLLHVGNDLSFLLGRESACEHHLHTITKLNELTTLVIYTLVNCTYSINLSSDAILKRASPDTITAASCTNYVTACSLRESAICSKTCLGVSPLMMNWFMSLLRSLHEYPMLIAVSILSPVRTQTLIPASFMNWIVSPTPSWSLSSIAVDPTRVKFFSNSSATLSICSSLPVIERFAYINLAFQASYSFWVIVYCEV